MIPRITSFVDISNKLKKRNLNFKTNSFLFGLKPAVLVIFMVLFTYVPLLSAAPVTIDDATQEDHETWESSGAGVVFISDQVGYVFYLDPGVPAGNRRDTFGAKPGGLPGRAGRRHRPTRHRFQSH